MIKIDFAHVKQIAQGTPIVMSHLQRESVSQILWHFATGGVNDIVMSWKGAL